jgi:hypothetical protein
VSHTVVLTAMSNSLNHDQFLVESVLRILYGDIDHGVGWASWSGDIG